MSTRDPLYGTTSTDPLTPTGEQGSTNEAERLDADAGSSGSMKDQLSDKAEELGGKAQEMGQQAQGKAADMGHMAQEKADAGMDAAASGLGQAASVLRQQGEQRNDAMGTAASRTAETLESASTYLRDKDTSQLLDDIEAFVRERPVESVLIAAGIGFVLSRIVK